MRCVGWLARSKPSSDERRGSDCNANLGEAFFALHLSVLSPALSPQLIFWDDVCQTVRL